MKKVVTALAILALVLTGCTADNNKTYEDINQIDKGTPPPPNGIDKGTPPPPNG